MPPQDVHVEAMKIEEAALADVAGHVAGGQAGGGGGVGRFFAGLGGDSGGARRLNILEKKLWAAFCAIDRDSSGKLSCVEIMVHSVFR